MTNVDIKLIECFDGLTDLLTDFTVTIPDDDSELMYNGTLKNLKTFLRKFGVIDIKEVRKEKLNKIYEKN